jgi:hypothetical protein
VHLLLERGREMESADVTELLNELDRRFISRRKPGRQTSFHDLLTLPTIDEATWVAATSSLVYRLDRENDRMHLRLPGTTLQFPVFMEEALRFVVTSTRLRVGDIPGLFASEGKVALAKQLIAVGVLEVRDEPGCAKFD